MRGIVTKRGLLKSVSQLLENWAWREIRNCPGRYVLRGGPVEQGARELFAIETEVFHFNLEAVQDEVIVLKIQGGGLISYRNETGTYVHTLADEEGFLRKLRDLGISGDVVSDSRKISDSG